MPSTAYNAIKAAIAAKQNISADYKGYPRIMTPHTLGYKDGKEKCLFYQFAGKSSSASTFPENSPTNWRCVFIDELSHVSAVGGTLHTCGTHTKRQTCVDNVDAEMRF